MHFQELTNFLDSLPAMGVPGADCVVYLKGKCVYRHQSGFSDIEKQIPVQTDALYNIYSATKLVTCVAALTLCERGLMSMSDRLSDYIPEYKTMYIEEQGTRRQATQPILIKDLFTMTTGFHHNIRCASIKNAVKESGRKAKTLDIVRAFAAEPLLFEPGSRWLYGLAHDVLAGVIEVVSGKTFGEYCREVIFEPLGMASTTFLPTEETEKRLAPMYLYDREKKQPIKISKRNVFRLGSEYESGGGGLISSVDDFIRFVSMLAMHGKTPDGHQILKPETIEAMRTNQLSPEIEDSFVWRNMEGYKYGLGVRTLYDKEQSGSNGSLREFGWSGAAGAYALIDPDLQLAVFYAQHVLESMEEDIQPRLRNLVYRGVYELNA